TREQMFPPRDVGLVIRVWRRGSELALGATSETPEGYAGRATTNGFTFTASPTDRLMISARVGPATVPPGSVFILVPRWSSSSALAWAEGAGIGAAIGQVLALASVVVGLVFMWWAATIAWGRPVDGRGHE